MNSPEADQKTLQNIVHDMRGPLVNIGGFHAELDESIRRLFHIIEGCSEQLPGNVNDSLNTLMEDDLEFLLRYLSKSIEQLHDRLDLLEKESLAGQE